VCVAALTVTARAQIGYWRDSVTLFQRALDVTTDNFPAHMFMAQTLYPLGREQEAIEHYETALRINPRAPDTIYNLGYAYHLSGRNVEALARFKEVLRYRPNHANANFHIGRTLVEAGEYRRAIEYSGGTPTGGGFRSRPSAGWGALRRLPQTATECGLEASWGYSISGSRPASF
ncbi:MAG: tetratricopeptide repeat protein, partial [Gemmatimonadetes bacterium]|nr:tetratricopeptide repeat protein [Gemmatimonadota bacterium]